MEFGPGACTRSPGQEAYGFAAVAERQNEQPRPAILAAVWITHHRTTAVVDLRLFSRCGQDDPCGFRRLGAAQLAYEALYRLIAAGKAVVRGHFDGRFCRYALSPVTRRPHHEAGRFQVSAGCLSTHTSGLLDAP